LGRYGAWCRVIGGVLENAGVSGFLGNSQRIYDSADTEAADWTAFLETWEADPEYGSRPVPSVLLLHCLTRFNDPWPIPAELAQRLDRSGDSGRTTVLGLALNRVKKRRFNERGLRVEHAGKDGHSKNTLWQVVADRPPEPDSSQ
jgi:hypothetical protein